MKHSRGAVRPASAPHTEPSLTPRITHDAIVIVPGIMGSELHDTSTDSVIWGIANPRWLARAWLHGKGLEPLHLTPDERVGDYSRVQPRRLLQTPVWSPFLRGIEPYTRLINLAESTAAHPDAVMPFPYDWRLPVAVNARRLADEARIHLQNWLAHPAQTAARRQAYEDRPARLVFIAHSMGGLVTNAALTLGGDSDLAADTRGILTLGTPFQGSVVAANILNALQGGPLPLPHGRLAAAAATMPAVHELLPRFLCLEDGLDVHRLTASDVDAIGGDKDLFTQALDFYAALDATSLPVQQPVVGVRQDTIQSMTIDQGIVRASEYCFLTHTDGELMREPTGAPRRTPVWGDGTVHRLSAAVSTPTIPVPAQHGALAANKRAMPLIEDFLLDHDALIRGPQQGDDGIGLRVPDFVTPGSAWECVVTGTDDPSAVECGIAAVDGSWSRRQLSLDVIGDDRLSSRVSLPAAGLYRITAKADYGPVVTQIVFAGAEV
ncbi:lipase/acyltransferase domain-containing protein [Streptomyces sp. PA5.6]|uniref:lipase/acyltransferase domain-containing protein n=1 Tax=Streptomyces sp. PA5.6 TaxID=3035651 RepID=UPI003904D463